MLFEYWKEQNSDNIEPVLNAEKFLKIHFLPARQPRASCRHCYLTMCRFRLAICLSANRADEPSAIRQAHTNAQGTHC